MYAVKEATDYNLMSFEFDLSFFIFMFSISNKWWNDTTIKCDEEVDQVLHIHG